MTDHEWRELAAPYALDALAPDERRAFEAHLAECVTCRADVQGFREVTGLLAHATPATPPPAGLRERVMREARRTRRINGGRRRPVLAWLAAAASVALALLAGDAYRKERVTRQALERSIGQARESLAVQQQLVATLLAPDVNSAVLASKGRPPSARLYWNLSRHRVVVAVFDLPPAPAGRTYQLWAIAQGKPVSLGLFNTTADGRVIAEMAVPAGLAFEVTAVTEEPAGGSPQPTQQPFLIGKLTGAD